MGLPVKVENKVVPTTIQTIWNYFSNIFSSQTTYLASTKLAPQKPSKPAVKREQKESRQSLSKYYELGSSLQEAVFANDMIKVKELLAAGADPNIADSHGKSIFQAACLRGTFEIFQTVLSNPKTNIFYRNFNGFTALHFAALSGNEEILRLLVSKFVQAKKSLDEPDTNSGSTPLMFALTYRYTWLIKIFLENGANPNALTYEKETALMLAASNGYEDIVDLILEYNPDADLKDIKGNTAMDWSLTETIRDKIQAYKNRKGGQISVVEFLEKTEKVVFKHDLIRIYEKLDKLEKNSHGLLLKH